MSFFFDPSEISGKKATKKSFIVDPCKICGLFKGCISPKMKSYGGNKKRILALGEAPGKDEDEFIDKETKEKGRGFVGKSGRLLTSILEDVDIDFDKDCTRSNVLQCRPPGNKFLPEKVEYCYQRLEKQIQESKPKLILCLGYEAIKRIAETSILPTTMEILHGIVFPSRKYNCWISCNYHPAYILRKPGMEDILYRDIKNALSYLDMPISESLLETGENIILEDKNDIIGFLESITNIKSAVSFDIETSKLSPYDKDSELLSIAFSFDEKIGYVFLLEPVDKDVWKALAHFLESKTPKICHSGKFDDSWGKVFFKNYMNNRYWDTQLAAHILDEHPDTKSLGFQTFLTTGDEYKEMVNRKNMKEVSKSILCKYNSLDARYTYCLYKKQIKQIIKENLSDPNKFLLAGDKALAQLEFNGIKIDRDAFYYYKDEVVNKKYKEAVQSLRSSELNSIFAKKKGRDIDLNSLVDLKFLFFRMINVKPASITEKGNLQLNEAFFNQYSDDPEIGEFCLNMLDYKSVLKMKTTYIKAIENHVDGNWFLHPTYNLWSTVTYRSSCDSPNLQNVPKRDEGQAEFRKVFIPRFDYLLDADHKGSEVVIQALLADDRTLIEQLKNGLDPHRFWASKLYQKPEEKITKKLRYNAKNGFIFPLIYGSYYVTIAKNLGLPEDHVKECEDEFFDMYCGINQYQQEKVREYNKKGYITTPLGFRRHAPLSRNQIVNYPIQSVSFHYLLDTLIKLVSLVMPDLKMKSLPVLQIHDNVVFDVVEKELDDLINIINELTEYKPNFKFVKDLAISVEYNIGRNWYEMEEL